MTTIRKFAATALIAAAALGLTTVSADAAPCRNAQGRFITCPGGTKPAARPAAKPAARSVAVAKPVSRPAAPAAKPAVAMRPVAPTRTVAAKPAAAPVRTAVTTRAPSAVRAPAAKPAAPAHKS